jgi:hypothetical protein
MREELASMTEDIRPHYRLEAWKEAMALVKSVDRVSRLVTGLHKSVKG